MKINSKIRKLHSELHELHTLLESRVKSIFEAKKRKQWFFIHRIKEEESFALKLETGRVPDPRAMEDFFACTLVVENRTAIAEASALVSEVCEVAYRRPAEEGKTHKSPDEFCFDDLRLYVKLKSSDLLPPSPLEDIIFEVQIKTFLQYAWGIATHDLVYKGKSADWGRARVAYQIKAMLEHAEISVERVDEIAQSSLLAVSDEKLRKLNSTIKWLCKTWSEEQLPKDLVRLGENIINLAQATNIELEEIFNCIEVDTKSGQGAALNDLTPYATILNSLYTHQKDKLEKFLRSDKKRFRIFLDNDAESSRRIAEIPQARPENFVTLK